MDELEWEKYRDKDGERGREGRREVERIIALYFEVVTVINYCSG